MEKQQSSSSLGVCEKLFHAFHINSTFPTIRRLTCRQQEPVPAINGPSLPSPVPNTPVTTNEFPKGQTKKQHAQEKHDPIHVSPKPKVFERKATDVAIPSVKPMPSMSTKPGKGKPSVVPSAVESMMPKSTSAVKGAAVAPSTAGLGKDKVAKNGKPAFAEEEMNRAGKYKWNINDKVDDYISRTKTKMGSGLGRTPTSKA